MFVTDDIEYVGVNDKTIDLFEGQYVVPNGMAYNSYVILDRKTAVIDTVDARFASEWLGNVSRVLSGKSPDYLIVQHMEPDHSANVVEFMNTYPNATIVSSLKAFNMMKNFFDTDFADRRIVVGEGDTLSLGAHNLTFVTAPMVHWPEVIVTYDSKDKVLFSADGFGKFGALDTDEDWACEARRYYIGIVGKYGAQVQTLLKKAAALDISIICPLHGPVLSENLGYFPVTEIAEGAQGKDFPVGLRQVMKGFICVDRDTAVDHHLRKVWCGFPVRIHRGRLLFLPEHLVILVPCNRTQPCTDVALSPERIPLSQRLVKGLLREFCSKVMVLAQPEQVSVYHIPVLQVYCFGSRHPHHLLSYS